MIEKINIGDYIHPLLDIISGGDSCLDRESSNVDQITTCKLKNLEFIETFHFGDSWEYTLTLYKKLKEIFLDEDYLILLLDDPTDDIGSLAIILNNDNIEPDIKILSKIEPNQTDILQEMSKSTHDFAVKFRTDEQRILFKLLFLDF